MKDEIADFYQEDFFWQGEDFDDEEDCEPELACIECGKQGNDTCQECGLPLCHMHHELGAGFCKKHPSQYYRG